MDILTQLLLGIGAFSLIVVVGSFIGIMMIVIEDTIEEQRQARERDKSTGEKSRNSLTNGK